MVDRFPGYDVRAKRWTPSWNTQTRAAMDQRLAVPRTPRFFTEREWRSVDAICARILPQSPEREQVPIAAYLDDKLTKDSGDGYRTADIPPIREAWRIGLYALDVDTHGRHGKPFHVLTADQQIGLLQAMQDGVLDGPEWAGMPSAVFFAERVLHDVVEGYYTHPAAWNEIGFGGPAGPRGYVRLGPDRRDHWEAAEARPGREARARRENKHVGR